MTENTRAVQDMIGSPNIPAGKVVGAECENGHRNADVKTKPLAEPGDRVRCKDCGEPVEQTLMDA